jgi:hypothetical protein
LSNRDLEGASKGLQEHILDAEKRALSSLYVRMNESGKD